MTLVQEVKIEKKSNGIRKEQERKGRGQPALSILTT